MNGHQFIHKATGEWMAYPGHPLVLAAAIMSIFPSYKEANAPTQYGWCEAVGDNRIPGAGDHVYAAMRCLSIGADGGTADQMIEYAKDYWNEGGAGGHAKNIEAGKRQAEAIEPSFRELAAAWFKPD